MGSTAGASWERRKSSPHDSEQSPAAVEDCADLSLVGPLWQPVKDVVNTITRSLSYLSTAMMSLCVYNKHLKKVEI